ncbi:MAG: hypothetical protein ROO71_09665 [Balneola sp.]
MSYLNFQSLKLGILLLILLFLNSCSITSDAEKDQILDVELLKQHWVHSHEENVDENGYIHPLNGIYRPSDYKVFPFAWFRMQYKFFEEGDAEFYYLAPNDGHYFKPAKWEVDTENRLLTLTDTSSQISNNPNFIIKELTKNKLVLEQIEEDR